jgi:hypothetical protein
MKGSRVQLATPSSFQARFSSIWLDLARNLAGLCRSLRRFRSQSLISFNLSASFSETTFQINKIISGPSMPRFAVLFACSILLSACADSTPHRVIPQDPPDYKGVPTDTTPPDMSIAPSRLIPSAKPQ